MLSTDKQTNRQLTNATKNITSFAKEVITSGLSKGIWCHGHSITSPSRQTTDYNMGHQSISTMESKPGDCG